MLWYGVKLDDCVFGNDELLLTDDDKAELYTDVEVEFKFEEAVFNDDGTILVLLLFSAFISIFELPEKEQ